MQIKITGVMIYYYKVCTKKLWYFIHHIGMESHNPDVALGKLLDENTYLKADKNILINNEINIDFLDRNGVINEVKKSRKIEEASVFQLKYYIYYLRQRGIDGITGKIDYPLLRQTQEVILTDKDVVEIEKAIVNIEEISNLIVPPNVEKKSFCKKCAYFDLCYI